jgi:alcohol dehydrogenase-like protein
LHSFLGGTETVKKALLLSKYKSLEIAHLPMPAAGVGEVLIRVWACGICGSDVHRYDGSSGRRTPPIHGSDASAGATSAAEFEHEASRKDEFARQNAAREVSFARIVGKGNVSGGVESVSRSIC